MKISFKPSAAHTDRALYTCLIIDNEILGNNMNYLFTDIDMDLMHILNQLENLLLFDLIIICLPHDIPTVLHTFDMLTCNSHKDLGEQNT